MVRLTSDRGSNFVASMSKAMCEVFGIEKNSATSWRPMSMGLVERFNGTLKALLKEYAEETGSNWHKGIQDYAFAYNTTVHSATGYTPFHLMHGWEAKVPYDLLVEGRGESGFVDVETYRNTMVNALEDCWAEARRNMGERDRVRQWNLASVARRTNGVPKYEVGERVWIYKPFVSKGESKAIRQLWWGPHPIVEKISDMVYVVARENRDDVVHVDRLKKYKTLDGDGPRQRYEARVRAEGEEEEKEGAEEEVEEEEKEEARGLEGRVEDEEDVDEEVVEEDDPAGDGEVLPDEDVRGREEEENEYEVEEVMDKQVLRSSGRLGPGRKVRYLVKWKNWGDEHNSWEAAEHLAGSRELVDEFEERAEARGDRI